MKILKPSFKARCNKNKFRKKLQWFPTPVSNAVIDTEALVERINLSCTVTRHDCKSVLSALQEQIIYALLQGCTVALDDLGYFRLGVNAVGSDTPDELSAVNIKSTHVLFFPHLKIKKAIEHIHWIKRVVPK